MFERFILPGVAAYNILTAPEDFSIVLILWAMPLFAVLLSALVFLMFHWLVGRKDG